MEQAERLNRFHKVTKKDWFAVIVGIGLGTAVIATFDQPPVPINQPVITQNQREKQEEPEQVRCVPAQPQSAEFVQVATPTAVAVEVTLTSSLVFICESDVR